jgi:hypothetical protein
LKITNHHRAHKRNTQRLEVERTELKNDLEARASRRETPNTPTDVKEI